MWAIGEVRECGYEQSESFALLSVVVEGESSAGSLSFLFPLRGARVSE